MGLRDIALNQSLNELPYKTASLRSRELREYGESRQCALFCYGISQVYGYDMKYAHYEKSDYDFVAVYEHDDILNYVTIQMKELVPDKLNPRADLEDELKKLAKYTDSEDLCVAIFINKATRIEFSELVIPELSIRELWFFGAQTPDQEDWWLIGNMLRNPQMHSFKYPTE